MGIGIGMPWVDDVLEGLQVTIDALWYDLLRLIAAIGWTLQKGLFLMGHAIELANLWLVDHAFAPLIAQTNNQMKVTASLAFTLALLVLGITYMLAVFVRLDVVSPRNAIGWYLAGAIFFQMGPELYQSMHQLRSELSAGFYAVALDSMQTGDGPFSSLNSVTSDQLDPGQVCDAFGPYTPGWAPSSTAHIDGMDVALAYLRADSYDVMGYPAPVFTGCVYPRPGPYDTGLPVSWQFEADGYFNVSYSSDLFDGMPSETRKEAIDRAAVAQFRIFSAWPLIIFGVIEQLIFLLLTIAQGLTFVSFSIAILFAFFKKTEVIARSVLDMWIELIIQTIVIALMQSLIISFLLGAAATNNALVVLGVSLLCSIFILVLLLSGIKAVWNSFNRLFGAIGQATGGVMVAPGRVAVGAAAAGTAAAMGGAALAANVGSNAAAGAYAASQGATVSQISGVALGGSRRLQTAARTLAYMPGTRNTRVGRMADEFTEGAALRQVGQSIPVVGRVAGPMIGAHLLSDRREQAKEKRSVSLPAEPVHIAPPPGTRSSLNQEPDAAARSQRMGTFTPLEGEPGRAVAANRVRQRIDTQGEEVEERVSAVGAAVRSQSGQTRSAVERVQRSADDQGEEVEERVSAVGADVRAQAGQTRLNAERAASASDLQGEEVEERIAMLGSQLQTPQPPPVMGLMTVEGTANVAGVMGDFVTQMRAQRTMDGQPVVGGTDHFTVAQGVARSMGVTPQADDRAPVVGDVARLGMFGNQALQLGLTGQQAQTVITEVKNSPTGELTAPTRTALVEQTRGTLNTGFEGAENAVNALQRAAAMLPNSITARGSAAVPAAMLAAPPDVSVPPMVNVTVATPGSSAGTAPSSLSPADLASSQVVQSQRGTTA